MNDEPVWRIRAKGVSVSLWHDDDTAGGRQALSARFEHTDRGGAGKTISSISLGPDELWLAIFCLEKTLERLAEPVTMDNDTYY